MEDRYEGKVVFFSCWSKFGYINCPTLRDSLGRDEVLFRVEDGQSAVGKGQDVTFSVDLRAIGGAEAKNVVRVDVARPSEYGEMAGKLCSSWSTQQWSSSTPSIPAPCAAAENLHSHPGQCSGSHVLAGSTSAYQLRNTACGQNCLEPNARYVGSVNDREGGCLCGNVDMKSAMKIVGHWHASPATADRLQPQCQAPQHQQSSNSRLMTLGESTDSDLRKLAQWILFLDTCQGSISRIIFTRCLKWQHGRQVQCHIEVV
jgi:hypothetical protein